MKTAVLGGGCFWCIEAIFQRFIGVASVRSGYAGGKSLNPTYYQVCSGNTGHAQVCEITYDPKILPYKVMIDIFLRIHDPTTLNRQGHDQGTQYRSIILYQTEQQKQSAKKSIKQAEQQKVYPDKIVTEVSKLEKFYPAELNHQNYYNENPTQGYCRAMIKPKLDKLYLKFKQRVDSSKL